jgi:hypothetical protein
MRPPSGLRARQQGARRPRDRGQVGGIEVLPFGILVFVAGTLLIANVWAVVDAKLAVAAASREAVRAYVESPDSWTAATSAAIRAGEALGAYGRNEPGRVHIIATLPDGGFGRCRRITITVSYRVPAVTVPWVGGFGRSFVARSTHTELVDPFRDGLEQGSCTT